MNNRTRSLWLPAMANLIVAPGLLMILQKLAVQPRVLWIGDMAMVLYLPWLVTLPIFGAFGAFLAKRAQRWPRESSDCWVVSGARRIRSLRASVAGRPGRRPAAAVRFPVRLLRAHDLQLGRAPSARPADRNFAIPA